MKRHLLVLATACLLGMSNLSAQSNRNCGTMDYLEQQLNADPAMSLRMQQIEQQTQSYLRLNDANKTSSVVTIPVVFHVLYSTNNTTQNISDARILEQLNVLNLDYSRTNADASNTPSVFQGVSANTGIQFCMAVRDPNGAATTGILRKSTTVTSFSSNDAVKFSAQGGDDAWPAGSYLNIWVCNLGGGLLGYAQFPGGAASTDGVVCLNGSIGGPAAPGTATPYHLGRTLTHEVGHWVNLRHIWGDSNCGNDLVSDTPIQQTSNFGCPAFPHVTCSNGPNGDMFMNYMDYTDDACMNNFTTGQSSRSNALFSVGGARVSLLSSQGCVPISGGGCGTPASLSATSVTQTTATLNWGAVSGASSYNVQYRLSPAGAWNLSSATINSKAVSGLSAATNYDFQVQAVCGATNGTYSSISTFTTLSTGGGCTGSDPYEPNNTKSTPATIAVNIDIYGLINTSTDKDYFKFTTTSSAPKIKVILDGLPGDYDVVLYKSSNGASLGSSVNGGTTSEQIVYNSATAGSTYKVYVYGYNGALSTTACYHLKVTTGATNFREMSAPASGSTKPGNVTLYPNPAIDQLTVALQSNEDQTSIISIIDMLGRTAVSIEQDLTQGANKIDVDLANLQNGVYFVNVTCNGEQTIQKLVVNK